MRGISIGPGEVAGYFGQLRCGFEALGVPCEHFLFVPPHQFGYSTSGHFLKRAYERFAQAKRGGRIGRCAARLADKIIRLMALVYAIFRYDVFIFSGYGSFFRFLELPLLRMLGKRIIVVYLGSDARPPYLSGRHLDDRNGTFDPVRIAAEARFLSRQMAWVERFASIIVNNTATAQFAQRSFVRYSHIGLPMAVSRSGEQPDPSQTSGGLLRILHAPSRPIAKGTLHVREVVDRMKADGIAVELVELSGVPNQEVLRQIALCDVVVDELYSDLPLATFGAEAASLGKPVIVGSLYVERFAADNPDAGSPTIFIDPKMLEDTLRRLVSDDKWRRAKGARGCEFVRDSWTPGAVAARYLRLAEGDIPNHWVVDPETLDYIGGWGLSEQIWRKQVAHFVAVAGESGLALAGRPRLRRRILDVLAGSPLS